MLIVRLVTSAKYGPSLPHPFLLYTLDQYRSASWVSLSAQEAHGSLDVGWEYIILPFNRRSSAQLKKKNMYIPLHNSECSSLAGHGTSISSGIFLSIPKTESRQHVRLLVVDIVQPECQVLTATLRP